MRSILLILSLWCFTFSVSGQIEKGTLLLGGSATINTQFNEEDGVFNLIASPTAGKFFTDKMAAGAFTSLGLTVIDENVLFLYGLNPFIRYYFNPQAPAQKWFLRGNAGISGFTGSGSSGSIFSIGAGVGFDHFLTPSIALEPILGLGAAFPSEGDPTFSFSLGAGLQFFLGNTARSEVASVQPAIASGTWMVGGTSGGFALTFGERPDNGITFDLSPNVGYFFTDRLVAGLRMGFNFTRLGEIDVNNTVYSVHPFGRYYLTSGKRLLWFAAVEAGVSGSSYKSENFDLSDSNFGAGLGLGADLFLTPNVALEAVLSAQDYGVTQVGIDLGIQLFLGNNNQ